MFKHYRNSALTEMEEWSSETDMEQVAISDEDLAAGSPKTGDMIARDPYDYSNMWLIAHAYFLEDYVQAEALS